MTLNRHFACAPLASICFVAVTTAGCAGEPVDPLAKDRAALLEMSRAPLEDNWPAEATVVLGEALMRTQLEAALQGAVEDAIPFLELESKLGNIKLKPTLAVDGVKFASTTGCADCVEITAQLNGTVGASLAGGLFGNLQIDAPYRGSATATVEVVVDSAPDSAPSDAGEGVVAVAAATGPKSSAPTDEAAPRRRVRVIPREGKWTVSLQIEGLPAEISREAEFVVQNAIQSAVAKKKIPPMEIAELPTTDVADVRGLRVRPTPMGLAVDFAFGVLQRGVATTPKDAGKGWVAQIPEATLLGLAHAAALKAGVQEGYAPEPIGVVIKDNTFLLTLRMWRVVAKPDFRTIEIAGRVAITEDGNVEVISDEAREVGKGGGFTLDPVVLITRAVMLEELRRALQAVVPAQHEESLGTAGSVRIRLERAVLDDGAVTLFGSAAIVRVGEV